MILSAFFISIKVVLVAVFISLIVGIAINYFDEKIKRWLEFIILLPMFLPPSAIGYIILISMGKRGFIGKALYENFDFSIIFTIIGAMVVGVIVSIPIMYQSIKVGLLEVNREIGLAALDLGASKMSLYRKILLPLCKKGILTGIVLSIGRVFGEFGATILVAGNIRGETQTVPMALYYAIENGDRITANTILIIIVLISIALTTIYNIILMKNKNGREEKL